VKRDDIGPIVYVLLRGNLIQVDKNLPKKMYTVSQKTSHFVIVYIFAKY